MLGENDPLLCDPSCELVDFAEEGDVVFRIHDPLGSVRLRARNIGASLGTFASIPGCSFLGVLQP